jgi:hypothetical protein
VQKAGSVPALDPQAPEPHRCRACLDWRTGALRARHHHPQEQRTCAHARGVSLDASMLPSSGAMRRQHTQMSTLNPSKVAAAPQAEVPSGGRGSPAPLHRRHSIAFADIDASDGSDEVCARHAATLRQAMMCDGAHAATGPPYCIMRSHRCFATTIAAFHHRGSNGPSSTRRRARFHYIAVPLAAMLHRGPGLFHVQFNTRF